MPLFVIARRDNSVLLAASHPAAADFGIEVHVDFILKDDRFFGRQVGQ